MLPPDTSIRSITLTVNDLGRVLDFYEGVLGFVRQRHEGSRVTLAASKGGPGLLTLDEQPAARRRPVQAPGLFHAAFLYPNRVGLARALKRVVERGGKFQGFADHLVSEALYLSDPEGNGVELYADRPRDAWTWIGSSVQMATEPLDLEGLMAELDGMETRSEDTPPEVRIGHIHLQVSDIQKSEQFWAATVGFDVVTRDYPGALFVSAGGYHHHVGLNVWNSRGSTLPEGLLTGLRSFSIAVPSKQAREELSKRLQQPWTEKWLSASDPDGIQVSFVPESHGPAAQV